MKETHSHAQVGKLLSAAHGKGSEALCEDKASPRPARQHLLRETVGGGGLSPDTCPRAGVGLTASYHPLIWLGGPMLGASAPAGLTWGLGSVGGTWSSG